MMIFGTNCSPAGDKNRSTKTMSHASPQCCPPNRGKATRRVNSRAGHDAVIGSQKCHQRVAYRRLRHDEAQVILNEVSGDARASPSRLERVNLNYSVRERRWRLSQIEQCLNRELQTNLKCHCWNAEHHYRRSTLHLN